jgi:hypothetical protein
MDLNVSPSSMIRTHRATNLDGTIPQTWLQAYGPGLLLITGSLLFLDGCQVVKGIFEAGVGVGIFAVLGIAAMVGFVVAMVMRKK